MADDPVQHAATSWSNWLKSVRAAAIAPDGSRTRMEGQNLHRELMTTVQVADVGHLAQPLDFAQAIGPITSAPIPAAASQSAVILATDPQGRGAWIEYANAAGAISAAVTYVRVFDANPFVSQPVTDAGKNDTGTRATTSTVWWGELLAGTLTGQKWYTAITGGLLPNFVPTPLYVPPGKHFCMFNISGGAALLQYALQWRDV